MFEKVGVKTVSDLKEKESPTESSDRILEEIKRALQSLEQVREREGCIIDESCRQCRRYEAKDQEGVKSNNNLGGRRRKNEYQAHCDNHVEQPC